MSSGVHRSVVFSRYLAAQQMDVSVLTVHPRAYTSINKKQQTPADVKVYRCFALDTARHLTIKGRYFGWMAQPDRWISWMPAAIWRGYKLLQRNNDAVIISTYPIATAHIIGYLLHRLTGKQWLADLRDPMLQDNYPTDPIRKRIFRWIEHKIINHASAAILTSPGAVTLYQQRYPDLPTEFWQYIPNGYDEITFTDLPEWPAENDNRFKLLHSGTIYPSERDPRSLFDAVVLLKQQQPQLASRLRIVLRATGHDELYKRQLAERNISEIVELASAIDYRLAAAEMLNADALLLLQASDCNYQTPAKAYEYIRAQKPVLVLAPVESDSWLLMKQTKISKRADLDDKESILEALIILMTQSEQTKLPASEIATFSREEGAISLERLINNLSKKNSINLR